MANFDDLPGAVSCPRCGWTGLSGEAVAPGGYLATILRGPEQLPVLDGECLELDWDHELKGEELAIVIRQGAREVWREPGYFECFHRFGEILTILRAKYGVRLKDLRPAQGTEGVLYGEALGAREQVREWRESLGKNSGKPIRLAATRPDSALVQQLAAKLSKLLEEFSEEVFTAAVNVAMQGGAREITLEALMQTDDPTVKALGEMHLQVRKCIDTLMPASARFE